MSIFSVYKESGIVEVSVYKSLADLTRHIEWQDVLGEHFTIIDATGNIYKWDDTRTEEYATTYNYSLRIARVDGELGKLCALHHQQNTFATEFVVKV